MQPYLGKATVEHALHELNLYHLVEAIVECDNITGTRERRFFLVCLIRDSTSDQLEDQFAQLLLRHLREKGYREGEFVTARRLPFTEAPHSNTGP